MKIFLALFIVCAYATEFPKSEDKVIKETYESRLEQSGADTFKYIMSFLGANEVLCLKILNRKIYHKVRILWPEMELFTIVDNSWPDRPVDFSHILEIRKIDIKDQAPLYNRAQLSCIRKLSLECRNIQVLIDLLPKNSLVSLRLRNLESTYTLVSKIDFPKLTHLELGPSIRLGPKTFNLLPNCMKILEIRCMDMGDTTSFSLAIALRDMDKLEVLSLRSCCLTKDGFSIIFKNLPTSLRRLDIRGVSLLGPNRKFSELGLERLEEMESLLEISFLGVGTDFAIEIILNLPEYITNIVCSMNSETLNAFQQRSSRFMNVKRINLLYVADTKLYSDIQKIFPNLDEDIKKKLVSLNL